MTHYDYIYSVCCYSGFHDPETHDPTRLQANVYKHLLFLQYYKYATTKKICVLLTQRGADVVATAMLEDLVKQFSQVDHLDIYIVPGPNWGMTVGSLWDAYRFCLKRDISADYWWTLDDDYICNHWAEREQLLNGKYSMVGQWETMGFVGRQADYYLACWEMGFKVPESIDPGVKVTLKALDAEEHDRAWTDGGYYMLKFDILRQLEQDRGVFMKVPLDSKGNREEISVENEGYYTHGIQWGEVGFPTLLRGAGMEITAFGDQSYLIARWERLDISQIPACHLCLDPEDTERNQFYFDKPTLAQEKVMQVKIPPRVNIRPLLQHYDHLRPAGYETTILSSNVQENTYWGKRLKLEREKKIQ